MPDDPSACFFGSRDHQAHCVRFRRKILYPSRMQQGDHSHRCRHAAGMTCIFNRSDYCETTAPLLGFAEGLSPSPGCVSLLQAESFKCLESKQTHISESLRGDTTDSHVVSRGWTMTWDVCLSHQERDALEGKAENLESNLVSPVSGFSLWRGFCLQDLVSLSARPCAEVAIT